jgi:L-asparaginase
MNEKFFRFSADSKVDGLVVEALGVGNVPPAAFEGIKIYRR